MERDDYTCQHCGSEATDVDHIVPGDDHDEANLVALCGTCHLAKTHREARANRR